MSGWTDEREQTLRKLWADGLSASQIARAMGGVTRNAVLGKCWRLGLPRRSRIAYKATLAYKPPKPKPVAPRTPKAPAMLPTVVVAVAAWDALPGSSPEPWEDRGSRCSWPIGDGLSCCEPVAGFGWCAAHLSIGRVSVKPSNRDLVRALRRYV